MKRDLRDGYAIRYAAVDDAVMLSRLASEGGDPLSADLIAALAADRRVFLAEEERSGRAVGVTAAGQLSGVLVVETLAVLGGARRLGIGSALLGAIEEFGRWALFPKVVAVARNGTAEGFLAHRGYVRADDARMPADLERLGNGRPVVVKRL